MLRFSANLGFLWPDRPLPEKIIAAARAGFKAIELHWPYDYSGRTVRELCEQHGLQLLGINTVRGDADKGEMGLGAIPGREREFQASVDEAISFSLEAGGNAIHCMAGKIVPQDRVRARSIFVHNLGEASAKAARAGLTILLEPLNTHDAAGYFYSKVSEAADIIREINRSNIKLMFDAYHVGMSGTDPSIEIVSYLPIIGHVQIAGVPTRAEPDEGTVDYRRFFATLDRLGYNGWIGAEYKPRLSTDQGLAWVQALGVGLG